MGTSEPRGAELIARYKANYHIAESADLSEAMILRHWELEKALRHQLLAATPENRWQVFEEAYTSLYEELDWLNRMTEPAQDAQQAQFRLWQSLIGQPPQQIYEIGSGKGELITYLAQQGFTCKATEITQERGKKWTSASPKLSWGASDGIHLAEFEPEGHYDVLLSNQVIEHMHPDDVPEHFAHAARLLRPGGRYILSTPHCADGPADVTRVFGHPAPLGMHLKEYTYGELDALLKQAGFRCEAVLRLPRPLRQALGLGPLSSRVYLRYLTLLEKLLLAIGSQPLRLRVTRAAKALLFTGNMLMVAHKR